MQRRQVRSVTRVDDVETVLRATLDQRFNAMGMDPTAESTKRCVRRVMLRPSVRVIVGFMRLGPRPDGPVGDWIASELEKACHEAKEAEG